MRALASTLQDKVLGKLDSIQVTWEPKTDKFDGYRYKVCTQ